MATAAPIAVHPPPTAEYAQLDLSKKTYQAERWFRLKTAIHSFRVLKNLSPQQIESFMNSYIIYSLDWEREDLMVETFGPDYHKKVGQCLTDYYSVLNHLCALGALTKMYIPPVMDTKASITRNQILYEQCIAKELRLPPSAHILDLGCGRGRVAAHMCLMTGARVTGLNIDADQIASARIHNAKTSRTSSNEFLVHDFNDLPLPLADESFDGFYQIQAFSLCKDVSALARELYRVLKPGAHLSLLDWARLPAFHPDDPHHARLMTAIKPLIGAVGTPTPDSLRRDLESAGFVVLKSEDASLPPVRTTRRAKKASSTGSESSDSSSEDDQQLVVGGDGGGGGGGGGSQASLITRVDTYFRGVEKSVLQLVKMGVLPKHFRTLLERMTRDCDAFLEADVKGLVTTSWHWVAVKPLEVPAVPGGNGETENESAV